jgi:carbonic anhydrase
MDSDGHGGESVAHWGYETDNGPDDWGSMNPDWAMCAQGSSQSPIDLVNATDTSLPAVSIHTPTAQEVDVLNQTGVVNELDNGHTIQINAKTGEKLTVEDKSYSLVQFHFHAPSEHTVDGEHFPMEMHFVHQADDRSLAVVGVLISEGAENIGIAPLWAHLPKGPGAQESIRIPEKFVEFIFPDIGSGFYHYEGSLTTPPCSEEVMWYVMKTPTEFSAIQIAEFTRIYNHNNRPVQVLNGRTVSLDESPSVTIQ